MRAFERLLAYATISTPSHDGTPYCPSTTEQLDFGKILVREMESLGLSHVYQNKQGFVFGTIPATAPSSSVVGFLAHMDTVDSVPYENITPAVVHAYEGGVIPLANGKDFLSPKDYPVLNQFIGKTLIVTDGNTLLGADDKAGIAEIMTFAEYFITHPEIPHGEIRLCFTPDEETGTGILSLDPQELKCDYAYTVDGSSFGEICCETFNASSCCVKIYGKSIHTGGAKGKMCNAARIAGEFDSLIPSTERPETTEGREGFYHLCSSAGTVEEATLNYILRDHDLSKLREREDMLHAVAEFINRKYGKNTVSLQISQQYRNMKDIIDRSPFLVEYAREGIVSLGRKPISNPVRGGTDGSRLSFKGVPCPNLGTGSFNHHGRFEFAVAEEMDLASILLEKIACKFAE